MSVLKIIITAVDSGFVVAIVATYFHAFLGSFKFRSIWVLLPYSVLFLSIYALVAFGSLPLVSAGCILLVTFLVACFYKGSLSLKLFSSIVITVLSILLEVAVGFMFAVFSAQSMEYIVNNSIFYVFGVLTPKVLTFMIVKIIQVFKASREGNVSYGIFAPLVLMPLATVLAIYVIYYHTYFVTDTRDITIITSAILLMIASNLFVLYIFERQIKHEHERETNALVQQQLKLQADYFKDLSEGHRLSAKAMHDAKNQLYAIAAHLNANEIDYAAEKMNVLCDNALNMANAIRTGNDALDALVNAKDKRINKSQIKFSCNVFMDTKSDVDDTDLCILIGNALDNAIEACEQIHGDGDRWIKLKITQIDDYLSIELLNSIAREVAIQNPMLRSTKKDKHRHGFGLRSMQEITNKYSGFMKYSIKEGAFHLKILLSVDVPTGNFVVK